MSVSANDLRALEFDKLKDEQLARISTRNKVIDRTLVGLGVIGAFALQYSNVHVLLAVPAWLAVMVWWYVDEDRKVVGLRRYFQRLGAALDSQLANEGPRVFGWEFPAGRGRGVAARLSRLAVNVGLFVVPGFLALFVWGRAGLGNGGRELTLGWVAGWAVMALVALAVGFNSATRSDARVSGR